MKGLLIEVFLVGGILTELCQYIFFNLVDYKLLSVTSREKRAAYSCYKV